MDPVKRQLRAHYFNKDGTSWDGYGCNYLIKTGKKRERDENGKCLTFERRDDI